MVNWNAEMDQRLLVAGIHLGGDWSRVTQKWQELYGNDPNVQQPTHQATMKHIERLRKGLGVSSRAAASRGSPSKKAKTKGDSPSSPVSESSNQCEESLAIKTEPNQGQKPGGCTKSCRAKGNASKKRKAKYSSENEESEEEQ